MKRLLTFIGIILLVAFGVIGGIFWERRGLSLFGGTGILPVITGWKPVPPTAPEAKKERKVLYYKCPMGLPDYSEKPGKAQCGMDYVPVYEDEAGGETKPGEIYITPEKTQRIGVRSEEATERPLKKNIRTVATVEYDERRLYTVNTKTEGWIERLHVNSTGREVRKGEPLLDIYSPDLVSTQEEYLLALETRRKFGEGALSEAIERSEAIIDVTKRRLRNWDISDDQIEALEKSRNPAKTMTLHSPVSGVVIEKTAVQGMKAMPGEKLFQIADLSHIWLYADVYEYELSLVRIGQRVKVTVNSYPGEAFYAMISYIYPYLNQETRTVRVRLEMDNPGFRLKPGMYGNAEIESTISQKAVTVPVDAVLDTGERQAVIVDLGAGRFKVQEVKAGLKGEGYYQILSGLKPGMKVVTSANFLIDSESSFKAAARTMLGMEHGKKEENVGAGLKPAPTAEHKGH